MPNEGLPSTGALRPVLSRFRERLRRSITLAIPSGSCDARRRSTSPPRRLPSKRLGLASAWPLPLCSECERTEWAADERGTGYGLAREFLSELRTLQREIGSIQLLQRIQGLSWEWAQRGARQRLFEMGELRKSDDRAGHFRIGQHEA